MHDQTDAIDAHIADLLVATSDSANPLLHPKVREALRILREHLKMDVVFVSQFKNGRRTFRVVDSNSNLIRIVAGQSDPLEESWCQRVVDGRLPQLVKDATAPIVAGDVPDPRFPIGTHLSTPVLLKNGNVYGTLCCFSHAVSESVSLRDLQRLQATARLLAQDLRDTPAASELQLEPMPETGFTKHKRDRG